MKCPIKRSFLLLVSVLWLVSLRAEEPTRYLFDHIPSSMTWINGFHQDNNGFLWIGTGSGLYRYPALKRGGSEEVLFAGDHIQHIQQDSEGLLWMRRRNDFIAYDPRTNTALDGEQSAALLGATTHLSSLFIDQEKNYWWIAEEQLWFKGVDGSEPQMVDRIGYQNNEWEFFCRNDILYLLSQEGKVRRYNYVDTQHIAHLDTLESPTPHSDHQYYIIYVDSRDVIWLSHGAKGVWCYDQQQESYRRFSTPNVPEGLICSIVEDAAGDIWIASDHGGIAIWRHASGRFTQLKHNRTDNNSIASNSVYALYRDREDNIWLGYAKQGVSIWRGENKAYSLLHLQSYYTHNLADDINVICEDLEGRLWYGTDSSGVVCFDPKSGREQIFTSANSALRSNVITALHCDNAGRVWIGTFLGGLTCYEKGRFVTYTHRDNDPSTLSSDNIWSLEHDNLGRIYIGTLGGGLQCFDPATRRFTTYNQAQHRLANDHILQIDRGHDGRIYIATAYGLSIFDPLTKHIETITTSKNNEKLTEQNLMGLCCDNYGSIWLNCEGQLKVYDTTTGHLLSVATPGLQSIQSLLKDSDNSIWVVADNGICHTLRVGTSNEGTPQFTSRIYRFPEQHIRFNQRSSCLTRSGAILVGSYNGYMRLAPRRDALNNNPRPRIYFTQLHINNTPIQVGERYGRRILLEEQLEYCTELELRHDEKFLTLDFATLNFSASFAPELRYRLQGQSNRWIPIDEQSQRLTFYDLKPGRYTLTIGTIAESQSEVVERTLKIRILKPWWYSSAALIGYALVVLLIGGTVWFVLRERQRRKIEDMERELQREKERYTQELKMQFFTNVSHDFRTPLTLILSPIEEMINKDPQKRNDIFISTIYRNAQRLLTLVNQLLDLRKLEMSDTTLRLTEGDLAILLGEVCDSFRLQAQNSGITLHLTTPEQPCRGCFDRDKVIKIVTNLLSNAFKFTPREGRIDVAIKPLDAHLMRVEVADSGCGIAEEDRKHIFDRFYQASNGGYTTGNGIGLHIAREFVTLHGGEISVEENTPQGALFSFTLPLLEPTTENSAPAEEQDEKSETRPEKVAAKPPVLMVVDDNEDFRHFMSESLKTEYEVITAANGAEALKRLESETVDLVVCDVMMPVMDGTEFCRRAKSNINFSHIPIILLTARTRQEDECTGLESGADDYITKPFHINILRLRITKLLEWKARAHALFARQIDIPTEQITTTSLDDRLLQMAIEAVNEHISNPEFSVSELSASLNMHRTHLYKKLLYITGKAPLEFIRAIRLKRAAQLLESESCYISEVAYMVGFNSPKIFARHFKEEFGCSPSEYQRTHTKNTPIKEEEL